MNLNSVEKVSVKSLILMGPLKLVGLLFEFHVTAAVWQWARVLGVDHYKRMPRVTVRVWHAKEPSLLDGNECRAQVKICNPSPAMVTSPSE